MFNEHINLEHPHSTRRISWHALTQLLMISAIAFGLASLSGSAWLTGAGTAIAPEPARLTDDLVGTTGATGAAILVYSQIQTSVIKWPGSFINPAIMPAGAANGVPCSTSDLANGNITYKKLSVLGPTSGGSYWVRCY